MASNFLFHSRSREASSRVTPPLRANFMQPGWQRHIKSQESSVPSLGGVYHCTSHKPLQLFHWVKGQRDQPTASAVCSLALCTLSHQCNYFDCDFFLSLVDNLNPMFFCEINVGIIIKKSQNALPQCRPTAILPVCTEAVHFGIFFFVNFELCHGQDKQQKLGCISIVV